MGSMTFLLPDPLPPEAQAALAAARIVGGYDLTPFPTAHELLPDRVTFTRHQNESGFAAVPWPVPGFGAPVTTTATLREQAAPYRLLVELARGKLNQVRCQSADWASIGLSRDDQFGADLSAAALAFGRMLAAESPADADRLAAGLLETSYGLADRLVRQYADEVYRTRQARGEATAARLGCRFAVAPPDSAVPAVRRAFNAVRLVPDWKRIEPVESGFDWSAFDAVVAWAAGTGLPVSVGPVLDLDRGPFPDWLAAWHGDFPSLAAFLCDFVELCVARYRDRVDDWLLISGFNHVAGLGLDEDDRLRLAVRLLDAARSAHHGGRWAVGLAQPWGDYLARDDNTYSPLVFADTLLRTGLPIGRFELELVCGDSPRASSVRDALDACRLIELFGVLGVPTEVLLSHPGRAEGSPSANAWSGSDGLDAQAAWAELMAGIAVSLPNVAGVYWADAADDPDANQFSGAFTADWDPKPVLDRLAGVRQNLLT